MGSLWRRKMQQGRNLFLARQESASLAFMRRRFLRAPTSIHLQGLGFGHKTSLVGRSSSFNVAGSRFKELSLSHHVSWYWRSELAKGFGLPKAVELSTFATLLGVTARFEARGVYSAYSRVSARSQADLL